MSLQTSWLRLHARPYIVPLTILLSACATTEQCQNAPSAVTSDAPLTARYTGQSVQGPLGTFMFIRRDNLACAVRFVSWCRSHDQKPPSVFSNGYESMSAKYELYVQSDGTFDFTRASVVASEGSVAALPSTGFGWHGRPRAGHNMTLTCGNMTLLWSPLHGLTFHSWTSTGFRLDSRLEIAVSRVREREGINFNDQSIKWYRASDLGNSAAIEFPVP